MYTKEQIKEMQEGAEAMRVYAATLPKGEERAEYEDAIAATEAGLRTYAMEEAPANTAPPVTPANVQPVDELDDDLNTDAVTDPDDVPLNPETEQGLAELRASLAAEGYDVGEEPEDLVSGGPARQYSAPTGPDAATAARLARYAREGVDSRVEALVESNRLVPFVADSVRASCYALLDAAPASGNLKTYSAAGGVTTADAREEAVFDLLAALAAGEELGLTRTYTRDTTEAAQGAGGMHLTLPSDADVNPQSAILLRDISKIASDRGVPISEATKIYEREQGRVTLKR